MDFRTEFPPATMSHRGDDLRSAVDPGAHPGAEPGAGPSAGARHAEHHAPAAQDRPAAAPLARDPDRWHRFEALVLDHGVPREMLLAHFPTAEDIEDIALTPDEDLAACARTVARELRPPAPVLAPPPVGEHVRCGDCCHFERSATHPHLGGCGAGRTATSAGGFWDTQRRCCTLFAAAGHGG